jgi:hypothetical protein
MHMDSETDMKLFRNSAKTTKREVKEENELVLNRQRTTVTKIHVYRVARPCRLVNSYRRFESGSDHLGQDIRTVWPCNTVLECTRSTSDKNVRLRSITVSMLVKTVGCLGAVSSAGWKLVLALSTCHMLFDTV